MTASCSTFVAVWRRKDGHCPSVRVRPIYASVGVASPRRCGASDLGVSQIWSRDADDTAHWIRRIVVRRTVPRVRDRVPYAMRPRRTPEVDPAEQALTAAHGI